MAFDLCGDCGCPLFKGYDTPHYKGCVRLTSARVVKTDAKKYLLRDLETYKNNIKHYKKKIEEIRDCIKDVCLDEIYECRWDCMSPLREAA